MLKNGTVQRPLASLSYHQSAVTRHCSRSFSNQRTPGVQKVTTLPNWQLDSFRQHALDPQLPVTLPYTRHQLPRACFEWFIHDSDLEHDLAQRPKSSELKTSFWSQYETTTVPLELTSTSDDTPSTSVDKGRVITFHRSEAPLKLLLSYMGNSSTPADSILPDRQPPHSIYLAQCDLESLPRELQDHLPTPELVRCSGKGDIYSSSLWLGRPPTYTPLHRDPNPNLFIQLAGRKVIRLFPPDLGRAIFDDVQDQLISSPSQQHSTRNSALFRGDEMMQGMERDLLHRAVWGVDECETVEGEHQSNRENDVYLRYALEANLALGEALYIPKGWWHSVKGIGDGITASVNWWFR